MLIGGGVQIVCCTNVLAQGVNFPAENVYIEHDIHSNLATYKQKLGRVGRPGFSNAKEVYYCIDSGIDIKHSLPKERPIEELIERRKI